MNERLTTEGHVCSPCVFFFFFDSDLIHLAGVDVD